MMGPMSEHETPSGPDATTSAFTVIALRELDDVAPASGFEDTMEARFARAALGCRRIGLSLQRIFPGAQQPFAHRHADDEEIYVAVAGSGRARIDDELVELRPWTALRVSPTAVRSFEAGEDGLELLAFGSHTEGDGEVLDAPAAG